VNTTPVRAAELSVKFAYAHALFRKPTPEQHAWLLSGECQSIWRELAAESDGLPSLLAAPAACEDYAERYIATFDVGTPAPPVPLIESHYNKREPVPRILHENILFYRQFGLQLRDSAMENADHLRHQLEFTQHLLAYLARFQESGKAAASTQVACALRDFVTRHLLSWLPEATACAAGAPLPLADPALRLTTFLAMQVIALTADPRCKEDTVRSEEAVPCSD